MICIISHKNDLISYGFFKAFKTLYKNVIIVYNHKQLTNITDDIKVFLINNYDFFDNIPIIKTCKYLLVNENCMFENKLNNNDCKYFIIKEYSDKINYEKDNFKKYEKYLYHNNKIIVIPYGSIFTKNEILWNYKKQIIVDKKMINEIILFDNINSQYIKDLINIKYTKINNKNIDNILNYIKTNKIFLSFYDNDKFDYKSLSVMSFGNFSITNSLLTKKNMNILEISNNNILDFYKIVQNIEIIYNDFTFEKYVKLINNYFLSLV